MVLLNDRVGVGTTTAGLGALALGSGLAAGIQPNRGGWKTFAEAGVTNGQVVRYLILDLNGAWEYGLGTYSDVVGSEWTLIEDRPISSPVAQADFLNLGAYNEIRVLLNDVPSSGSGLRQIFVSTNNGSTFLTTASDYRNIAPTGTEGAVTAISTTSGPETVAVTCETTITCWNLSGVFKPVYTDTRNTSAGVAMVMTTTPLNALRVKDTVGNMTAGSIQVWGR